VDLSRFHATFFAESREGLDAMEAGLLDIESGAADGETIHRVFRAAHSIKGGAGTFGFDAIASLTHVLETLLEEIRSDRREADTRTLSALLSSVDVLRELLDAAEHGSTADPRRAAEVQETLEDVLAGNPAGESTAAVAAPTPAAEAPRQPTAPSAGWRVRFEPEPSLFMSGNDPLRILRELAELGDLQAECDLDRLPGFDELDPHQVHLAWTLHLPASVAREGIEEAFAWVEDECRLQIDAIQGEAAEAAREPIAAQADLAAVPAAAVPVVSPAPDARAKAKAPATAAALAPADSTLRVQTEKVDTLINLVGELVITQSMLQQGAAGLEPRVHERLLAGLAQLERNTRELQEAVIGIRMLPVGSVFSRFPRLVRDLSTRLDKQVKLRTEGESTELDKGVIEKIADPLVHLVRNAIDHGLEPTAERRAAGKPEAGSITLSAAHRGGHIIIVVSDDGRGLNREKILAKAAERGLPLPEQPTDAQVWELVFHPGFSTADAVTDLSGRGVGMDVVKKNIVGLGGDVSIDSTPGAGTRVEVRLPLTLAILDGMTVDVGGETFVLPLNFVIEALPPGSAEVRRVRGSGRMLKVRGDYVPLLSLGEMFSLQAASDRDPMVVIVESDGRRMAVEVDALLGQQQVVVKNLEANYRRIPGISGATIMGDGRVALIVDIGGLARKLAFAETGQPGVHVAASPEALQ